ncbi:hypothetical protein Ciccas_013845, partial [Cichlidogyrus casuarinus]
FKLKGVIEILLIGFYQPIRELNDILAHYQKELKIPVRYLQEFTSLGTAGGINQFRDQINMDSPDLIFVMNSDICGALPLAEMLEFHASLNPSTPKFVILGTEATRSQANSFGCIVECAESHEVTHYVEKPETFVSATINCGVYLFTPSIFNFIRIAYLSHQNTKDCELAPGSCRESINMEKEVFPQLAGTGHLFVYQTDRFWSQIKSSSAVIYANRHILAMYEDNHPERLQPRTFSSQMATSNGHKEGPVIIGHVYIHPTAKISPSAVIGPNVSIAEGASIAEGVRLRDCIVLRSAEIRAHACCLNTVIGWESVIGEWSRIEGTPNDPNPNKPFSKLDVKPVFNEKGQLNPSITVIGYQVVVPSEVVVFNSIVLPHKELSSCVCNQIIL